MQSTNPLQNGPSDFEYIIDTLTEEWKERFTEDNQDYGDDANRLGTKGAFVDIYRKVGKLKRAIWDDQQLRGEQPRQILFDLIGHCYLTIASMDQPRNQPIVFSDRKES